MSQQQGDDKNSMNILWIVFGVLFICAMIWWGFSEQLKQVFIFIKLWELRFLGFVVNTFNLHSFASDIRSSLNLIENMNPGNITSDAALKVTVVAGSYLRFPIALITLYGCYYFYVKNVKVRYKKRYSMVTLMQQERSLWPQIEVVSKLNLVDRDLDSGPWAMGYTPMQFCKQNQLLQIEIDASKGYGNKLKFIAHLNKPKAEKVFANQLGRAWRGPDHMAPHRKALFAVFAARGCRDTKSATALIEAMNRTLGAGRNFDYKGVDALVNKHYNNRDVQNICKSHAYEHTIIMSMLLFARQDGVLAASDFLWLKPLDRKFWYVLNSVGRQTPFVEAAGVHGHWLAEKSLGKPLSNPFLKEAVAGLDIAVKEIIFQPTPEEKDELLKRFEEQK